MGQMDPGGCQSFRYKILPHNLKLLDSYHFSSKASNLSPLSFTSLTHPSLRNPIMKFLYKYTEN